MNRIVGTWLLQSSSSLAALMITYPSTHGVFEEKITEITSLNNAVLII